MPTRPDINPEIVANEIKTYISDKKFDLVDYSYANIETYPPPDCDNYPEIRKFCSQWAKFFDEAEAATVDATEEPGEVTFSEVLDKYSPDLADGLKAFDKATQSIEWLVNRDEKFWTELRGIVLPLYEKSPYYEQWKDARWKTISLSYDPTPLEVKTTQMWTNQRTGERIRGEEIRSTEYPAGLVVKVN